MVSLSANPGPYNDGGVKWYMLLENLPHSVLRQNCHSNWRPIKDLLYYIVSEVEPSTKRDNFTNCNVIPLYKCAVCEFADPKLRQIAYDGIQCRALRGSKLQAFLCQRRGSGFMEQTAGPIDSETGETRIANVPMITIGNEFYRSYLSSATSPIGDPQLEYFSSTPSLTPSHVMRPSSSSDTTTRSSCDDWSYLYPHLDSPNPPNRAMVGPLGTKMSPSTSPNHTQAHKYIWQSNIVGGGQGPEIAYYEIRIRSFNIDLKVRDLEQHLRGTLGLHVHRVKPSGSSPTAYATFHGVFDAYAAVQYLDNALMFGSKLSARFVGKVPREDCNVSKREWWSTPTVPNRRRPRPFSTYSPTSHRWTAGPERPRRESGPVIIDGARE